MASKRKIVNVRDSDSDEPEFLLAPCFQIDRSVQLKDIPTNGEEYLLKVINERRKCLVVTKCNKDYSRFAKKQTQFAQEIEPVKAAPDELKPTLEWQNIQVADFSDTRMYISRLQAKKESWPETVKKSNIEYHDIPRWKHFFHTHSPTLSVVFGLNQTMFDRGLEVLINFLMVVEPGETISCRTGQWLYAFLACINLPLLPDSISLLRELARKCADIRSHIKVDDENAIAAVAPLNIFICLVSRYFRQTDLADQ